MRRALLLSSAVLPLVLALAAPAAASLLPFEGTLEYVFPATLGTHPGGVVVSLPVSGNVLVNASGAPGHLTTLSMWTNMAGGNVSVAALPNAVVTQLTVSVPPTSLMGVFGIFGPLSGGGAGATISRTAFGTNTFGGNGVMLMPGLLRLCFLGFCGPPVGATLPLSPVGSGFTATAMGGALSYKIIGGLWTLGTALVLDTPARLLTPMGGTTFTQSEMGFAHGPASATSSTAQPSGVVQFVTPALVTSNTGDPSLGGFGRFTVHFVPEPRQGLLMASGAALLTLLGWRRRG